MSDGRPGAGVSIVVPAYNEENSIARTLESLLAQTRPADEIVVADGGSTDRTREIAREFAARTPPVRLVDNPRRRVGAARNVGIRAARFRWVALIDAGNYADPRWLEHLLEPLAATDEPVVSFGSVVPCTESVFESCVARVTFDYLFSPVTTPEEERRRATEGKEMISSSCMAYPREVLERVGGYPEWLETSEDKLFVRRVRQLGIPLVRRAEAIVYHHMRRSAAAVARMYFRYGRGNGLSGQTAKRTRRLAARYAAAAAVAGIAAASGSATVRWLLTALLAMGASLYVARNGYRPVVRSGGRLSPGMLLLAPVVLLARDAGSLAGHAVGLVERLRNRRDAAQLREYLS